MRDLSTSKNLSVHRAMCVRTPRLSLIAFIFIELASLVELGCSVVIPEGEIDCENSSQCPNLWHCHTNINKKCYSTPENATKTSQNEGTVSTLDATADTPVLDAAPPSAVNGDGAAIDCEVCPDSNPCINNQCNAPTCGGCLIDASCYKLDEVDPKNPCLICSLQGSIPQLLPLNAGTGCGNDNNPCMKCDGNGGCKPVSAESKTKCGQDEGPCRGQGYCDGKGACAENHSKADTPCGPKNGCMGDLCDGKGNCRTQVPLPDNTECGPAKGCYAAYTCSNGACNANALPSKTPCDRDAGLCRAGECDGNGACQTVYSPAGTPCNDNDPKTSNDVCNANGGCKGTPTSS